VKVLTQQLTLVPGIVFPAHCRCCCTNYFPDCYRVGRNDRRQFLEFDTKYLRISKHGVWTESTIAKMQEQAVLQMHAGWSSFALWINDSSQNEKQVLTTRQSQRLYVENLAQKLLVLHQKQDASLPAHPNTQQMPGAIRDLLGKDGGRIPISMEHGCLECTHHKRYREDLIREGVRFELAGNCIADLQDNGDPETTATGKRLVDEHTITQTHSQLQPPTQGSVLGYV
jgi:hypothetical protein